MRVSTAKKILNIANQLDMHGLYAEAEKLTDIVRTAQMPGGSNPAAGYAQQPRQMPQNPAQQPQANNPQAPQPNVQQMQGYPSKNIFENVPYAKPQVYNGPQTQPVYNPNSTPANNGQYQGWYQANVAPYVNTPYKGVAPNLLSNIPASPFFVAKDGVAQPGMSVQDSFNNSAKSMQNQYNQATGVADAVDNARKMQIEKEMLDAQAKYWKLWEEQQRQLAGDGRQT